jgi:hypothetical protein
VRRTPLEQTVAPYNSSFVFNLKPSSPAPQRRIQRRRTTRPIPYRRTTSRMGEWRRLVRRGPLPGESETDPTFVKSLSAPDLFGNTCAVRRVRNCTCAAPPLAPSRSVGYLCPQTCRHVGATRAAPHLGKADAAPRAALDGLGRQGAIARRGAPSAGLGRGLLRCLLRRLLAARRADQRAGAAPIRRAALEASHDARHEAALWLDETVP